jgi:6-phosphofructokinase
VLIPESPPDVDDWEAKMCDALLHGREVGRRDIMVIVAEGATDRNGKPITTEHVKKCWRPAWAKTCASPCWATSSAAARPAPSTAT